MPRRKIVKFEEDGEEWFGYESRCNNIVNNSPTLTVNDNPTPTLKELVDLCDLQAESRNNHGFVCLHRLLAKLLIGEVGEEYTTNIMKTIAIYGGLDGMNGCNGEPDAYEDLKLHRDWSEYDF